MENYPKLQEVTALDDYNLLLLFANGERRIFDFSENLKHPYYQKLFNPALFKRVTVRDGEIEWATGQDFCPHTLYEKSVYYAD